MTRLRHNLMLICSALTALAASLTFASSSAYAQAAPASAEQGAAAEEESKPDAAAAGDAAGESASDPDAAETGEVEAPVDGATYRVRLRDLEQKVDELKEQIRRSHTRLSLLSDTILSGASGGARAEIEFINDLSGAWHVVEAIFVLDGAVQYKKTDDTGVLAKQREIPIFSGSVPTGDHTLQVMLKLRGHGFGVFSYLRGMEASVRADHSFTLTDGKVLALKVTAWEQGGPTTPVEEQPAIRFQPTVRTLSDIPKAAPASSGASVKSSSSSDDGKASGGLSVSGDAAKK